ncbi:universal stress protein [Streptomyces sp. MS06]|uniref:universal stress protein n=1 Tax=Streptomyces sp. MS06 TaxID=3385974 RepID=UPI0039A31575
MDEQTDDKGIVVGVDGSAASVAALRWAARQARALDVPVVAVHAWEPAAEPAPYAPASARLSVAERRERAAEALAGTVSAAFGPQAGPGVRAVLAEGPAARVLLRQAQGAVLLALGRRAHGRWELPAVGAVGRECLRHARVPVVTVPVTEGSVPRPRMAGTPALTGSGAT